MNALQKVVTGTWRDATKLDEEEVIEVESREVPGDDQ
jgi:hypothetical protein